jgi:hypothetical protein
MADSRIKSVSELLSSFFDQDTVKKGELYSSFGHSWKTIAGSRLGEHSHPVDIKHGILIVETEHQGWMQLLQLQQDKMLEETQQRFPDLGIRGIAFRLGNPAGPVSGAAVERTWVGTATPSPVTPSPQVPNPVPGKGAAGGKDGTEGRLPPDLEAMFARIKKNIGK